MLQVNLWKNVKTKNQLKKQYLILYEELVPIARQCGYALAIHGSKTRDLDLIAVPWVDKPLKPETLIKRIEKHIGVAEHMRSYWKKQGTNKPLGRKSYVIHIAWWGSYMATVKNNRKKKVPSYKGFAYIDISFTPHVK